MLSSAGAGRAGWSCSRPPRSHGRHPTLRCPAPRPLLQLDARSRQAGDDGPASAGQRWRAHRTTAAVARSRSSARCRHFMVPGCWGLRPRAIDLQLEQAATPAPHAACRATGGTRATAAAIKVRGTQPLAGRLARTTLQCLVCELYYCLPCPCWMAAACPWQVFASGPSCTHTHDVAPLPRPSEPALRVAYSQKFPRRGHCCHQTSITCTPIRRRLSPLVL